MGAALGWIVRTESVAQFLIEPKLLEISRLDPCTAGMGLYHSIRGKARGFEGMYIRHRRRRMTILPLESISAYMVDKRYRERIPYFFDDAIQ
jgi:hypothetical protein